MISVIKFQTKPNAFVLADLEYFDKTFVKIRVPCWCMHERNVVVSANCIAVDGKGSVKFLLTGFFRFLKAPAV